jgi:hypothetical protein
LEQSSIISHGTHGLKLICIEGGINAGNTIIKSSPALLIESTADGISAISAKLTSTNSDKLLKIAAQGLIDLDEALVSSGGSININTSEDISIQSTSMTGKIESGELLFESTGSNRKLYVDNATLSGHSIKAYGLQIEGTPASGNIQQL